MCVIPTRTKYPEILKNNISSTSNQMESKIFERSNRSGGSAGSGVGEQIAKLLLVRRRGPHGDLITVLSFGGTRLIIQWRQKGRNASSVGIHIYQIYIYIYSSVMYIMMCIYIHTVSSNFPRRENTAIGYYFFFGSPIPRIIPPSPSSTPRIRRRWKIYEFNTLLQQQSRNHPPARQPDLWR